jgi:hypothetical protein
MAMEVTAGALVSRLIVTESEPVFPALSVAEHVNVVPVVSVVTLCVLHPVVLATPEPESLTVQDTVTLLVYQPFEPCVPVTLGLIVGAVLSTRTVTIGDVKEFPARSTVTTRRS